MNNSNFKPTSTIFGVTLVGQLLFFIVALFLVDENSSSLENSNTYFLIAPFILIAGILGAYFVRNHHSRLAKEFTGNSDDKLSHYRQWLVTRLAIIEGANLMLLCLMLFTGNKVYLSIFFIVGLATFILLRPNLKEVKEWYHLTEGEIA